MRLYIDRYTSLPSTVIGAVEMNKRTTFSLKSISHTYFIAKERTRFCFA